MGEELEIYILKKLDDAIMESKVSVEFHFAARLFLPSLHKEFCDLRELIEKKRTNIKVAAAAAASKKESTTGPSNAPARPHPRPAVRDPAANVAKIPDVSKPCAPAATTAKEESKVLLPAGGVKKSEAPGDGADEKKIGAPTDAGGDKKDTGGPLDCGEDKKDGGAPQDAGGYKKDTSAPLDGGDKKESGAPLDGGDEKESDTPEDAGDDKESALDAGDHRETGAPWDAGDKKETDAPLDVGDKNETDAASDVACDKKESSAPSDATSDEEDTDASLAESGKKESDAPLARTSSKTTSQDESEISPATDDVTGDKSITPPAAAGDGEKESNASKTATLAKTSTDESEISPVTDDDATDHKSKTPPTSAGDGKKESGVPPAVSNTVVTKPVNEEDLLREQLYYLNNVLTEWQMITKKPFSYSSDSLSSVKDLSKTLKKIKLDLKPETTKQTEESSHSGIPPTPEVVEFRWSTRLVNLEKVHGFEDKILSLERLLVLRRKDTDTFKAFGIHGMAGVGKTTLCQSIFSRPKVSGYFFPRIWVCLSKQKGEDEDNQKEVVKRMLRCLGIDDKIINKVDEKQGTRGLLFALRLQLTGKRYFIVLDDAHNADEWFNMPDSDTENDNNKIYETFSYGLPKECGGTVIVTSRVEQIVKNMVGDEENLRCIEPLTDEDTCWKIFKDTVEEDGTQFPEDLNKLKLEIVKRCDGLPLAAKLLGQIKHKELKENPTFAGTQRSSSR